MSQPEAPWERGEAPHVPALPPLALVVMPSDGGGTTEADGVGGIGGIDGTVGTVDGGSARVDEAAGTVDGGTVGVDEADGDGAAVATVDVDGDDAADVDGVVGAEGSMPGDSPFDAAEPPARTEEMTAAHALAYASPTPHPTGAAAAPHPPKIPLAPAKTMQARFNLLADGMVYLVVFLGGCLGTALRYGLSLLMPGPAAAGGALGAFHTATFLANMCSCFIYAMVATYLSQAAWHGRRSRQLASHGLCMGMCGGFSTLSALAIEELQALRGAQIGGFVVYMLATFVCGLILAFCGAKAGMAASARREARLVADAVRSVHRSSGRHAADRREQAPEHAADSPQSGIVFVDASAPPEGDYGQPVAIEPEPVTDEIPLVGDPTTGEAVAEADAVRDAGESPSGNLPGDLADDLAGDLAGAEGAER